MKTRVPAFFAAGALTLSLAACGGDEPAEPEETTDAAAEEGEGGGVLSLLADLASTTEEVDNYTMDIAVTTTDPEFGDSEVTMTYEVMDDPEAVQVTMVMPDLGEMFLGLAELSGESSDLTAEELGTSIFIIPAEGEPLVSNHNGNLDVPTEWARGASGMEGAPSPENTFDASDLSDIAGVVAGIETFEEAGSEEINGVGTTRVDGSLTGEEIDALPEEQRSALNKLTGGSLEGAMNISLWIADDGFPMRMDFADDVSDVSIVFSALGETSFEMPSEDQITDQ
ncbi:LppX_LprAFG lipoprotein [Nocardiopsis sp. FIRDI 009]|uniref:LppX_LprAFG lipoprotein n=1 Tax=Nocardiopsis sp. FIRDI 009 TaxID=714197 RepID=UPI000E24666C|nr:LppX_LprAFG lipoprotein [Nocardiopsis sp. FIRDI 009]